MNTTELTSEIGGLILGLFDDLGAAKSDALKFKIDALASKITSKCVTTVSALYDEELSEQGKSLTFDQKVRLIEVAMNMAGRMELTPEAQKDLDESKRHLVEVVYMMLKKLVEA